MNSCLISIQWLPDKLQMLNMHSIFCSSRACLFASTTQIKTNVDWGWFTKQQTIICCLFILNCDVMLHVNVILHVFILGLSPSVSSIISGSLTTKHCVVHTQLRSQKLVVNCGCTRVWTFNWSTFLSFQDNVHALWMRHFNTLIHVHLYYEIFMFSMKVKIFH